MKNPLLRLLAATILGLAVFKSAAEQLSLGIDRNTGRLIATDVWNNKEFNEMAKDSGRKVDEDHGGLQNDVGVAHYRFSFFLANTFELETNGTCVEASMIIGYYTLPGYNNPSRFISHFWVEASDDSGSLGAAYYGYAAGYPSHYEEHKPISLVTVEVLSREKPQAGEVLWILKVKYSVNLNRPVDFIPKLKIDCSMGADVWTYFTYGSQHRATAFELKRQFKRNILVSTNLSKNGQSAIPVKSGAQPTTGITSSSLPEITLSITKKDGFLLITFSPTVVGANLEQANMNSYPWAWQPAITATNSATNGWYVVPTIEPRVFRVRIDR
jgi:hypothetical protein